MAIYNDLNYTYIDSFEYKKQRTHTILIRQSV